MASSVVKGEDFDTVDSEHIHTIVEVAPRFPGGDVARRAFFRENLRFPQEAREQNIQGTVSVRFVVEIDGSLSNIEAISSPGESLSQEAVRFIESMPNWIPGKSRGKRVRAQFIIPITFTLAPEIRKDAQLRRI